MKTGSAAVTGKGKKRLNGFLRFVRTVIILALILGITGGIAVAAVNIAVIGKHKKIPRAEISERKGSRGKGEGFCLFADSPRCGNGA